MPYSLNLFTIKNKMNYEKVNDWPGSSLDAVIV